MLVTSKDLLLVVISFCILWFTVFVCWAMYYLIAMLRHASKMTLSLREKIEAIDSILKLVKDKLEKGTSHIGLIADSAIKLVSYFVEKQNTSSGSSRKKK